MPVNPWPDNGGLYRGVESFDTSWVASPTPLQTLTYDLSHFDGYPWDESLIHEESAEERKIRRRRERAQNRENRSDQRRARCRTFWDSFKDLFRETTISLSPSLTMPFVPNELWKAYGYWARPVVNGVQVHNATPRPLPGITIDPDNVWNSLRGPNGTPHPENWPARFEHPALPPRPLEWSTPRPGASIPFPSDVQLNPYLQHRYIGPHPICFDIGRVPGGIVYNTHETTAIPLDPADFAQPATYPFVTHMHIVGVADDPAPGFPWPIMVRNEQGITCADVFQTIASNFQQYVTTDEYNSWSGRRRDLAARAYHRRIRTPLDWNQPEDVPGPYDGLRRIDYMGDKVMFRGLEASPLKDGTWLMFVGPP
ncbi:hypothetical protein HYDPIDRAFT_99725 [Hydnomerulius pinastri MD-312]|uniref:DUF6699 domain-containing protein n=1 Tax=Hydnomerulius pinastri MD-312 TaxID=994086 RepID=A0A0C9VQH7_9AGAM|nr:hypothetical protein HYDPIDRAFT_99725 [Hydnomerulius pinastri MD-312]